MICITTIRFSYIIFSYKMERFLFTTPTLVLYTVRNMKVMKVRSHYALTLVFKKIYIYYNEIRALTSMSTPSK